MKAKLVDYDSEGKRLRFWCEGCKESHVIRVQGHSIGPGPLWGWNGDTERPTITPSVKTTYTGYDEDTPIQKVCHIYVTDGVVDFLNDCTHELAGTKVPLPDLQKMGEGT